MSRLVLAPYVLIAGCIVPADPGNEGSGFAPGTDSDPDPCFTTSTLVAGETHPDDGNGYFRLRVGRDGREYMIHVPAGYTGEQEVPVVFALHGMLQDAAQFGLEGSDMEAKSDEEGFIAVFPNGFTESWNAGACCPLASSQDRDDTGFLRALVDELVQTHGLCVDRERVYAAGFSNGGHMSYRLGCEASDVFAAITSVAGALVYDPDRCASTRTRPVPLLHVHGDADPLQPIDGSGPYTGRASVATWAELNGCDPTPVPTTEPPTSLDDTTCVTYPGCRGGAETTFCTVRDGGHCWFGNDTCGTGGELRSLLQGDAQGIVATDAAWSFFERHRCPSCER